MKAPSAKSLYAPGRAEHRQGRVEWLVLLALIGLTCLLAYLFPDKRGAVLAASWRYLLEIMYVLPAIAVVLGLFKLYITGDKVRRLLGRASGLKGFMLAIGLGSLPTGPLFVAFPLAAELVRKGARVANVVALLSAWACLKLPQELMELQFLGPWFLAARLGATLLVVAFIALVTEKLAGMEVLRHVSRST